MSTLCNESRPIQPDSNPQQVRVSRFSHGVLGGTYISHTPPPPSRFALHFSYPHSPQPQPPQEAPLVIRDGQAPQLSGHRRFSSRVPSGSDLSVFGSQPGSRCTSCGERARRICRHSSRSLSRSSPSYASPRSPAGLPTSSPRCACLTALSPSFLFCHTGLASS